MPNHTSILIELLIDCFLLIFRPFFTLIFWAEKLIFQQQKFATYVVIYFCIRFAYISSFAKFLYLAFCWSFAIFDVNLFLSRYLRHYLDYAPHNLGHTAYNIPANDFITIKQNPC